MDNALTEIKRQTAAAVTELLAQAKLKEGQILVVGCSTSEVKGAKMGTAGSEEVGGAILAALREACADAGVYLAVQCCEHLNRALVVERPVQEAYNLDEVSVVPVAKAGGSLAARAMREFAAPVVVETIKAHAGLDIGGTLIGMHLRRVAVPLRLSERTVGQAAVTAARTRPPLIGGERAKYTFPACE